MLLYYIVNQKLEFKLNVTKNISSYYFTFKDSNNLKLESH